MVPSSEPFSSSDLAPLSVIVLATLETLLLLLLLPQAVSVIATIVYSKVSFIGLFIA